MIQSPRITVCVATKNRTDMLHQLLWSLIRQQYQAWDLLIVDDSDEPVHWDRIGVYPRLFSEMKRTGHDVRIAIGPRVNRIGAAFQVGFAASDPASPLFLRVDDDAWLEPDYLARLVSVMEDPEMGACGGLFLHPGGPVETLSRGDLRYRHGRIEHLSDRVNVQWFRHESDQLITVEHLTANILFSRRWLERIGGFEAHLYAQHRDETQVSWRLHVEGARLAVNPRAVAWHLRGVNGGARGHHPDVYLNDHRTFMAQRRTMKPGIHIHLGHAIGDGLMATPMLAVMRRMNPDRNIAVFAPWAADVLTGNPAVNAIASDPLDAQRTVRLDQSVYGWASAHQWKAHLADAYCRMFNLPGPEDLTPSLHLEGESTPADLPTGEYLVIAPWSSAKTFDFYQPSGNKNWPMDRWEAVVALAHQQGLAVVQLRGSAEEPLVPSVDVDLCGKPLRQVFVCISRARLVVSVDSMAHHAAAALRVPSVVLWGRSKSENFGYRKPFIVNIQGECPGVPIERPVLLDDMSEPTLMTVIQERPCINGDQWAMDQQKCPIEGHPCMGTITVDQVLSAILSLVEADLGRCQPAMQENTSVTLQKSEVQDISRSARDRGPTSVGTTAANRDGLMTVPAGDRP